MEGIDHVLIREMNQFCYFKANLVFEIKMRVKKEDVNKDDLHKNDRMNQCFFEKAIY